MTPASLLFYAERRDPARNMARFYALDVTEDLFGHLWLERRWGRIGTRGKTMLERVGDAAEAHARIGALMRLKTRRGYQPI